MKILLLGNCQVLSMTALLEAAGYKDVTTFRFNEIKPANLEPDYIRGFDMVVVHDIYRNRPNIAEALKDHPRLVTLPVLFFNGFSPDDEVNVTFDGGSGALLSRIAVGAFRNGLSQQEALKLYSPEYCDLLSYPEALERARQNLVRRLAPSIPEAEHLYAKWYARGVFFYTANHPKLFVVEDVLRHGLRRQAGIELPEALSDFCPDPLQVFACSPQMNHPDVKNALTDPGHLRKRGRQVITCKDFVEYCYTLLAANKGTVVYNSVANTEFDAALARWRAPPPPAKAANPYRSQPPRAFWSRTVARPAPDAVSPIGQTTALIGRSTKVATAGSCFAQHVARAMVADGLHYYVAEQAPAEMPEELAQERGYGLFSARFGNIYSTRQLLQLIQRAYGDYTPLETAWPVEGGYVDPFRPNIGEIFDTPEAVAEARVAHLAQVRQMFETLDVFVFTMGLTEGWVDRRDGASFPVAPAAVSDGINPGHFGFVNSDYRAVQREMAEFLACLGRVNPAARVILTVSPVPLIATYTETDVLSATTYSKSVLRAVAGDLASDYANVFYFPSYEIITGAFNRGAYFEKDLRSVRPEGVAHVMRVFRDILVTGAETAPLPEPAEDSAPDEDYERQADVVCDEEMLLR